MTAPRATFIPDLLEEHYEELQFLWGQRESALRSPRYTMRELGMLEERIEARVQGLLAVGERALPLLESGLTGDDAQAAFAAAYAMLRLRNNAAASRVLDELSQTSGPRLHGLRTALCHALAEHLLPRVHSLFLSAPTPIAAAAAEVLAFQSTFQPTAQQIERFVLDEDPATRASGWRTVGYLGVPMSPKSYAAAMRDDDAAVKRTAMTTAAWNAQPGILLLARQAAERPAPENEELLYLLATLGTAEDLRPIATIAKAKELGPARFRILGAYGHPSLVDVLLTAMADPDPAAAAAAGDAFTRITGHPVSSGSRARVPPADGHEPDDFEAEFQDEVVLPDPELAGRHWQAMKPQLARSTRICKGLDVDRGVSPDAFAKLDMESRWEIFLRSKFRGAWSGTPISLEVFPQRR